MRGLPIAVVTAIAALLLQATHAFSPSSGSDGVQRAAVDADGNVVSAKKRKRKKKKDKSPPSPPMYVVVDSLADKGGNSCSASTQPPEALPGRGETNGECTLRAGIEQANGLSSGMPMVVLLRPGRYRLASPLPELTGKIELRGADGPFPRPKTKKKKKTQGAGKAADADADDVDDPEFRPREHRLAPIGTTLDGGDTVQILRTAYGSKVKLQSLRLEGGAARDEASGDVRDTLGGALHALGSLTVNNSVVRRNRAINGGGIYAEGKTKLENSLLVENRADRCGGMIYTAGPAAVSRCEVRSNTCGHFDCKKLDDASGKPGAPLPSWRKRRASARAGSFDDDDDEADDDDAPPEGEDATGAIAEGPPLTPRGVAAAAASAASADDATAAGDGGGKKGARKARRPRRRKDSKLSASEHDELDALADSVDADMETDLDEEGRQQLLEAQEDDEEAAAHAHERSTAATAAPPPPPPCDPERHGGKTGQPHELTCAPKMWRTGGKMATECVRWAATANCSADGERLADEDRSCFEFVPSDAAGYCECAGGHRAMPSSCDEHEPFTCQRECALLRQRRRRSKPKKEPIADATAGAGATAGAAAVPRLYAIGAFGSASRGALDGFGLICSDGSKTALVGTRPSTAADAWEFVCPGWQICTDAHDAWDPVTRGPLCAAWAAKGECQANAEYMREQCARSCNACPPQPPPEGSAPPLGLASLDVRAGLYVDALRMHCGPADAPTRLPTWETADAPAAASPDEAAADGAALVSDWRGGEGGDECPLTCKGGADGYRTGGLIEGLIASGGSRIDRLEVHKCTSDLEV